MTFSSLVNPPQPSYEPTDLWAAAAERHWLAVAVAVVLFVVSRWKTESAPSPREPLLVRLPILVWALQVVRLRLHQFAAPTPPYILWHDLFVALLGLALVLAAIALCSCTEDQRKREARARILPDLALAAAVVAPILDHVLVLFFWSGAAGMLRG